MSRLKKIVLLVLGAGIVLSGGYSGAVPPDFNADRRVNVRCPSNIQTDRVNQIELDGFKNTIYRLYHELDKNLQASEKKAKNGYTFSADVNKGHFFVCHAKAAFPSGRLLTLTPQAEIDFQEVFFIVEIDWDKYQVQLVRQRNLQKHAIGIADFETGFLWYNALLDKQKAYIPIYGFLSLPGEADMFPTIWNSWEGSKRDTATPPESIVDYDFYKILDFRNGYYLLGKDYNEIDYRDNVEDFGIIGWVEEKYITLWRSRLYYHSNAEVQFYDRMDPASVSAVTDEINRFYVQHSYLQERLFRDIVEKIDQESLHRFYTHFGFPQLSVPEYIGKSNYTKVFIPGAFTPRLMRLLAKSLKKNLNTFFLLDVSESMRPFADYVKSFNTAVRDMKQEGIGLRVNRTFCYWDTPESALDLNTQPNFVRVKRPEDIEFVKGSKDLNYAEPLMRALLKVMGEIEALQKQRHILPLHEKLLFVMTDAGPNDLTEEALAQAAQKARALNLSIYLVYPDRSGVRVRNPKLTDTPAHAYAGLVDLAKIMENTAGKNTSVSFRKFMFQSEVLTSTKQRQKDFIAQQRQVLGGIQAYIDHIFTGAVATDIPKDVVLYFSDEQLLTEMQRWNDRKIQILNHVVKYIKDHQSGPWEERIAIPAKPVESYLRAVRTQDDISLSDLKKLVIINSLVSVDDIEKCRELYDHIKPLIERKMFKTADSVFYKALTNKEPGQNLQWNSALGESRGPLMKYLAKRGFHLNSFNQAVQRKFMYLKIDELYEQ